MNLKEKESLISKQERAAKQQELLEKRRRARAEYNISSTKSEKKVVERKPRKQKRQKTEGKTKIFSGGDNIDSLKKAAQERKAAQEKRAAHKKGTEGNLSVSQWFLSICWLKIPVIGFVYALILALSSKTPVEKRNFARGYILYRCLVIFLAMTILYVVYRVGLGFVEELLSYVNT